MGEQHFCGCKDKDGHYSMYTYKEFEVREYFTSKYLEKSGIKNIITRIHNAFMKGINEHSQLPRLIVLVMDDDIIRGGRCEDDADFTVFYTRILDYIMWDMDKQLNLYKELLPSKCKREGIPHILWLAPPTHKNFYSRNNEE